VQRRNRARAVCVKPKAIFGNLFKSDPSENTRKKYQTRVDGINALETKMQSLSDMQLREKTAEFKNRVKGGEKLESILPEAFAVSAAKWGNGDRAPTALKLLLATCMRCTSCSKDDGVRNVQTPFKMQRPCSWHMDMTPDLPHHYLLDDPW
jgi:hypothetical protein